MSREQDPYRSNKTKKKKQLDSWTYNNGEQKRNKCKTKKKKDRNHM